MIIKGPQGKLRSINDQGIQGETGARKWPTRRTLYTMPGIPGPQGPQGEQGPQGDRDTRRNWYYVEQEDGLPGLPGPQGPQGEQGPQ